MVYLKQSYLWSGALNRSGTFNPPINIAQKSRGKNPLLDINIQKINKYGGHRLAVTSGTYRGKFKISLIDPRGNVSFEKNASLYQNRRVEIPLPSSGGLNFVILECEGTELVKRIYLSDSFNQSAA